MKKNKKIFFGILGGILVVSLGFFGVRAILERTVETEKEVRVIDDEETKEEIKYLKLGLKAEFLGEYLFREGLGEEFRSEILKLARELEGIREEELGEIFREDFKVLKEEVRGMEGVLEKEFKDEGEKQLEFMETVAEATERKKVNYVILRTVFDGDRGRLEETGGVVFNGVEIFQVRKEGEVYCFIGGEEEVGINLEDLEGSGLEETEEISIVKKTGEKIELGEGFKTLLKRGKLTAVKAEFSSEGEGKIRKTEISLRGKGTWDLEEELEERGILGVVGERYVENNLPATIKATLEILGEEE